MNYPDQKVPVFPEVSRQTGADGAMKTASRNASPAACVPWPRPADAIHLEPAENDGTVQAGPRYASVYQIHKTRCIFCGFCEEACPVGAIFMGQAGLRTRAVYDKKRLRVGQDGPARAGHHGERANG